MIRHVHATQSLSAHVVATGARAHAEITFREAPLVPRGQSAAACSTAASAFKAYIIDHLGILGNMSHTIRKKKKLALRVARIRGQVEALARALDGEAECGDVLRLIASARGAMDSLMAEVIEGHIRDHAFRGARAKSEDGRTRPRMLVDQNLERDGVPSAPWRWRRRARRPKESIVAMLSWTRR